MSDERWQPIPEVDGYEVSDCGRVRSFKRRTPNILAGGTTKAGYRTVQLSQHGSARTFYVHRLVLLAFVGPAPAAAVTRHLDGDPSNNHLTNLAYGTYSENLADAVDHGTYSNGRDRQTHCKHGHEFTEANTIRRPGRDVRECRECNRTATRLRARARYHARSE